MYACVCVRDFFVRGMFGQSKETVLRNVSWHAKRFVLVRLVDTQCCFRIRSWLRDLDTPIKESSSGDWMAHGECEQYYAQDP